MTALDGLDFGVVSPCASAVADVNVDAASGAKIHVSARFFQTQARSIEAFVRDDFLPVARLRIDDSNYLCTEETVVRECNFVFDAIPGHREQFAIAIPGGLETDTLFDKEHGVRGRIVRERWPLHGSLTVDTAKGGDALKLHITVANESDVDAADLATTLRTSFLSLSLNVNAA